MSTINFIVFILFVVYIVWTWNSTKDFETIVMRISYLAIGTIFIVLFNLILFAISRIGVSYPKEEMIGEVRRIVLLVFIPINGFVILTQVASMFSQAKSGILSKDELSKKLKIRIIIFVLLTFIEIIYFKKIQYGIIDFITAKF